MADYRSFVKSKLNEIEKERERFLSALSVLDEADSVNLRSVLTNGRSSQPESKPVTVSSTILEVLESSGPKTTREVYDIVSPKCETVTPKSTYTSLHRLRGRGKVVKEGPHWKAVSAPTASSEHQQP